MALITCYGPEGREIKKEAVDVRECIEFCGFTLKPEDFKADKDYQKIKESVETITDIKSTEKKYKGKTKK